MRSGESRHAQRTGTDWRPHHRRFATKSARSQSKRRKEACGRCPLLFFMILRPERCSSCEFSSGHNDVCSQRSPKVKIIAYFLVFHRWLVCFTLSIQATSIKAQRSPSHSYEAPDGSGYLQGDVKNVIWKPWSLVWLSEWKWILAKEPVVCSGGTEREVQNFPRTGSWYRGPSRI